MIGRRSSFTIQTFSHESNGILLSPLLLTLMLCGLHFIQITGYFCESFISFCLHHYSLRQTIPTKGTVILHRRKKISSLSSSSWQRQTLILFSFAVPLFHPCATTFSEIILQRSVVGRNSFKRDWDLLHLEGLDVRTTSYTVTLILLISALRCFVMR